MGFDAQYRRLVILPRIFVDGAPATVQGLAPFARAGYGHFTTMQMRFGGVRGLAWHLSRLTQATDELFGVKVSSAEWLEVLLPAVEGCEQATLRISVIGRDYGPRRVVGPTSLTTLVRVDHAADWRVAPMRLRVVAQVRFAPHIKHLGQFELVAHQRSAVLAGYDDAVLCTREGAICEGTSWNIGFFEGDRLLWPNGPQLDGTTRRQLDEAWRARGGDSAVVRVSRDDLAGMHGAFCCNSGGLWPVRSIDDREWGESCAAFAMLHTLWEQLPFDPLLRPS